MRSKLTMRSKSGTWLRVREWLSAPALPQLALCCLALCVLAACEGPPSSAYIGGAPSGRHRASTRAATAATSEASASEK